MGQDGFEQMIRDELEAREPGRQPPPHKQRKEAGDGEQDADMPRADASQASRKLYTARRSPTPTPSRRASPTVHEKTKKVPPCGALFVWGGGEGLKWAPPSLF